MVTVVKSEWHQVEKRYSLEIDLELLEEIYPDLDDNELMKLHSDLVKGDADIEAIVGDAWETGVDMDWMWMDEDDWWTDRKGGYEVTYSYGDN